MNELEYWHWLHFSEVIESFINSGALFVSVDAMRFVFDTHSLSIVMPIIRDGDT